MPIVEVSANKKLTTHEVTMVKQKGELIGYPDPRKIWVRSTDGLQQSDVMYVKIFAEITDLSKQNFPQFCNEIGRCLKDVSGLSVEVLVFSISSSYWHPTEEGEKIYGNT